MNSTPVTLPGYDFNEKIHSSSRTLVYRGEKLANGQPVAIKLMRHEYPSFSELVQFRNQYAIAKNLKIQGIVKTYALERYENRYALIMEDMGGISLAEYEGRTSLSIPQFLNLALQFSEILHQLHNHSVIHKDIKPANILIHPETKQIKLIDFSISSLLPRETQTIQTPNVLEGTLAYLSPEQTGRMNRGIDYRSDFYSLGVTFYELLAGTLPFNKKEPLELIHAHIAERPKPIGNICPQTISDIVLKLMAKNAEDRYQNALGLKYDLEKCLIQYQENGEIERFTLGERDICSRFLIPEKLYGRENEVKTLLDAFDRFATGHSEMMLVAGFSGIGKTAVVNEVHKPIVKQRGYFIKGKFDQFNRNIPFSAFVQAFRSLMGQILSESDLQLQEWQTKILEAVGTNGQVLIDVIPELESVIGKQPPAPELSGSAAQNRFNLLFEKFIAVFTTKEHPLVMFLDDLQWVDSASLNLIKVLMKDGERGYLLLLGAYRDNEVSGAHPLMLTLAELEKREAAVSTITLSPLSVKHINQLVAETLSCNLEQSQPLTDLVYQKTQGNPFFTTQFLLGLYEDDLIVFNSNLGYWECDLVQVRDAALTSDVVEFMAGRLQKLAVSSQEVLKLAACIGNQFDLETLAIVRESSSEEIATEIWSALRERIVLPISEAYKFFQGEIDSTEIETVAVNYRFLHDCVQQAAYSLIPEEQKLFTHLNIGRLLLKKHSTSQREEKIFEIVGHLNIGLELITQQSQRYELAQLNLIAGKKAKICTAYTAAFEYLSRGLEMLAEDSWQAEYKLTLDLYVEATEMSYLKGDFELMEQFGTTVLESASNLLDKIQIYETQLQAHSVRNQFLEGIHVGLMCLKLLGVDLPENPDTAEIGAWLGRTQKTLSPFSPEEILRFPKMTDPAMLSAMRILSRMIPLSYFGRPSLFPLISCQGILLSLEYGNTIDTPVAYVNYALVLCNPGVDRFADGYQYGKVAKQLIELQHDKKCNTIVLNNFYSHISFWSEHSRNGLSYLMDAYQSGLEVGELEFAAYALTNRMQLAYRVSPALEQIKPEFESAIEFARSIKFEGTAQYTACRLQVVLNLLNSYSAPWSLTGDVYNQKTAIEEFKKSRNFVGLSIHYSCQMHLSYLFGHIFEAIDSINEGENYLSAIGGYIILPEFAFFASLTCLAAGELATNGQKNQHFERSQLWSDRLNMWANHAPMNYQHKADLVEAERQRLLGNKIEAIDLYDRAISGAKENRYIQEEALANELAAKFYLDWGKEKIARAYLIDAYYCYARWGAKAKTDDLEERYPELLKPILQRTRDFWSSEISLMASHSQTASVANISSILDFSSLLKASQTLSGEIELDRLLSTLMKIILENAGSTKGALLLTGEQGLTVEAIASRKNDELQLDLLNQSMSLEDYQDLPVGLINYVRRTTQTALLDAKTAQTQFAADKYLQCFSPQSLLGLPLLERGNLIGVLYLENTLTADAFTKDRIELLDALCAQAAISLTNARLYRQAQQAVKDLQEAQLQLVQNEKMATLGNLVAGVAHEINNPVGFIGGNVNAAQEHLQDLLDILALYQQKYPNPDAELAEELEERDIEFIGEDFPKLIDSMQEGCDRIREISRSLRTFSRTDTDAKTEFNLHDGIDSTLLILKYRLKANEHRPAIDIVKNYGNLPEVNCYAGPINQVFINLLANAIDALDEGNVGKTFHEIARSPNCITINTFLSEDKQNVIIQIADNGTGMPEDVKAKIFEQGFTTKGVGKGTGLGMAIAHQIITEKHGGAIACHSELTKGTEFIISLPTHSL